MLETSAPINVWLPAKDLERSRRFYEGLLGLPCWREEPGVALHFGLAGGILTLRRTERAAPAPHAAKLLLALDRSIDQVCRRLEEQGLVLEEPLQDREEGRSAMLRDPDGHEIWLCRPSATETQFLRWRLRDRSKNRRIPVNRPRTTRRHELPPRSRRGPHPRE